jgi:hypothetical protein
MLSLRLHGADNPTLTHHLSVHFSLRHRSQSVANLSVYLDLSSV